MSEPHGHWFWAVCHGGRIQHCAFMSHVDGRNRVTKTACGFWPKSVPYTSAPAWSGGYISWKRCGKCAAAEKAINGKEGQGDGGG